MYHCLYICHIHTFIVVLCEGEGARDSSHLGERALDVRVWNKTGALEVNKGCLVGPELTRPIKTEPVEI